MTADLSIVVPTLNEGARLPALLDSLRVALESFEGEAELIVVDGGSVDGTRDLAARSGARVLGAARGRGVQLRHGASEANGDLLLFLHADTRVAPGALGALAAAFDDPELIACGMRQRVAGARRVYRWIENAANARVRRGWVYGDSGLCARRSAYDAVGGFRELPIFEDLDLARRLRRRGTVRLVDGAELEISPRRWERDGVVRRSVLNWVLTAAYFCGVSPGWLVRYYPSEPPSAE